MNDFYGTMLQLGMNERELERQIYNEGMGSKSGVKNPYSKALDIRSYTTWQAGVSDR